MAHPKYKNIGEPDDIVIEECSELIKILVKVKRFGLGNHHPKTKESNISMVKHEIADVKRAIKKYETWLKKEIGA